MMSHLSFNNHEQFQTKSKIESRSNYSNDESKLPDKFYIPHIPELLENFSKLKTDR